MNGRFTLGENSADLAGLTISYAAYRRSLGGARISGPGRAQRRSAILHRLGPGVARKYRVNNLKNRLLIDPHSPAEYRVNGAVRNVPAFFFAFQVKPGDKMYLPPNQRVKIW